MQTLGVDVTDKDAWMVSYGGTVQNDHSVAATNENIGPMRKEKGNQLGIFRKIWWTNAAPASEAKLCFTLCWTKHSK